MSIDYGDDDDDVVDEEERERKKKERNVWNWENTLKPPPNICNHFIL